MCTRFEDDAIAETFEAAFEIGDGSGLADLVEIGFAELAVGQVLSEHAETRILWAMARAARMAPRRALRRWYLSLR